MTVKYTMVQKGGEDLFLYAHIDASIIAAPACAATPDTIAVVLAGAGTSAYKPILAAKGGAKAWLEDLARESGRDGGFAHWCLTAWSAGGQLAKDICQGPVWPDAIVLLDAVYGSKPPGARRGDGQVIMDAGLKALVRYAIAAARGERTMVLFHSRIGTNYASSKECCEAIQREVERATGEAMGPDPSVTPELLDGHRFVEALSLGNFHLVEFPGIDAKEHIREAHLYDEVWRLWVPWAKRPPGDEVPDTDPSPGAKQGDTLPSGMPAMRAETPTLRVGSRGPSVTRWQLFLGGQGFLVGAADGAFGPKTESATKSFQLRYGLKADGVVGQATWAMAAQLGLRAPGQVIVPEVPAPPADLVPLTGAERAALFGAFRYVPAPTESNPEAIKILDGWASGHIVTVDIPEIAHLHGAPAKGRVQFHKAGAAQLRRLFDAWRDAGLLKQLVSWGGTFVPRFVRGSRTTLSNHAYGTAFDVNIQQNAFGAQPAPLGAFGSVRELVPLANAHGFAWGGHYRGRPDGMHFELAKLL